jgi:hypothetical protein
MLHEFYHPLIEAKGFEMPIRKEEKEANTYAKEFFKTNNRGFTYQKGVRGC